MADRTVQQSLRRFGVTVTTSAAAATATSSARGEVSEEAKNDRPKPFLFNLLTGGAHDALSIREQEKKERRRRRRRRGEDDDDEKQRQLQRQEGNKLKSTSSPPLGSSSSSPSLLAPCPVCGALLRRGLELDAHVAAEVAAGLDEEGAEGGAAGREVVTGVPPPPPRPRVLPLPAAAPLPQPKTSKAAVFELSDARAEVALLQNRSTSSKATAATAEAAAAAATAAAAQAEWQQQQQHRQPRRPLPPAPRVLRLPRLGERRFNHFADGSGAWGDETLGIEGASGAQAWQARGVSGIGDPFRAAGGGASGE